MAPASHRPGGVNLGFVDVVVDLLHVRQGLQNAVECRESAHGVLDRQRYLELVAEEQKPGWRGAVAATAGPWSATAGPEGGASSAVLAGIEVITGPVSTGK